MSAKGVMHTRLQEETFWLKQPWVCLSAVLQPQIFLIPSCQIFFRFVCNPRYSSISDNAQNAIDPSSL